MTTYAIAYNMTGVQYSPLLDGEGNFAGWASTSPIYTGPAYGPIYKNDTFIINGSIKTTPTETTYAQTINGVLTVEQGVSLIGDFHGATAAFNSGAEAQLVIFSDATANFYAGSSANNITVATGGEVHILDGATDNGSLVIGGGSLTIQNRYGAPPSLSYDATVGSTEQSNPFSYDYLVVEGGDANQPSRTIRPVVLKSGRLQVYSGGQSTDASIYGFLQIYSQGSDFNSIIRNGGSLFLLGGSTEKTDIFGSAYIYSGSIATNITVNAGAQATVFSNGKLNAKLITQSNDASNVVSVPGQTSIFGTLTINQGAILDGLVLVQEKTSIVNILGQFSGDASFKIYYGGLVKIENASISRDWDVHGGVLAFSNGSTAGVSRIKLSSDVSYLQANFDPNIKSSDLAKFSSVEDLRNKIPFATLTFDSASDAGISTLNLESGSGVLFRGTSSAAHATIQLSIGSDLGFLANSSAGSSNISSNGGKIYFADDATAGNSHIEFNKGIMYVLDRATLGQSTIVTPGANANSFSGIFLINQASSGASTIQLNSDPANANLGTGGIYYTQNSSSDGSKIINDSHLGSISNLKNSIEKILNPDFRSYNTLDDVLKSVKPVPGLMFTDNSTANHTQITTLNNGLTGFSKGATLLNSSMTNDGGITILFEDWSGSARGSILTNRNQGGFTFFQISDGMNILNDSGVISIATDTLGGNTIRNTNKSALTVTPFFKNLNSNHTSDAATLINDHSTAVFVASEIVPLMLNGTEITNQNGGDIAFGGYEFGDIILHNLDTTSTASFAVKGNSFSVARVDGRGNFAISLNLDVGTAGSDDQMLGSISGTVANGVTPSLHKVGDGNLFLDGTIKDIDLIVSSGKLTLGSNSVFDGKIYINGSEKSAEVEIAAVSRSQIYFDQNGTNSTVVKIRSIADFHGAFFDFDTSMEFIDLCDVQYQAGSMASLYGGELHLSINGQQYSISMQGMTATWQTYVLSPDATGGTLISINTAMLPVAPSITSSSSATFAENGTGTAYAAVATDPNGAPIKWSISGGADANLFNIDASTGSVTFKVTPNYEQPNDVGGNNIYDIIIRAFDGSLSSDKAISITVTDVLETASGSLHGLEYFWKPNAEGQHILLNGVTNTVLGGTQPAEAANAPIQFKNITWDAMGHASADVYAHLTAATGSMDLHIGVGTGTMASFASSLTSDWSLIPNQVGNELLISGISLTPLATGDVKVGTITFETGSASQMRLSVDTGTKIGSVNATPNVFSIAHKTTGADGSYAITPLDAGSYTVKATRSTSDIGTAITSADALAALKIAVAMNPNPGSGSTQLAVSPFQIMAADANQDGKVTSADALAILKMAVHMTNAVTPEWMFVEETRDLSGITRTSAAWDHNITANVQGDTTVNLAGFIKGDVNGSWTPPAGTQYVETTDPTHFTNLNSVFHIPLSEWAIA